MDTMMIIPERIAATCRGTPERRCVGYESHPLPFRFRRLRSGSLPILVMQAAQNRECGDVSGALGWRNWYALRMGHVLVDALMRPRTVEVRHIGAEDAPQTRLAHHQDVVQAFAPYTSEQPLTDRIRTWSFDRRGEHLYPCSHRDGIEVRPIVRIIVLDQVFRRLTKGRRLPLRRLTAWLCPMTASTGSWSTKCPAGLSS